MLNVTPIVIISLQDYTEHDFIVLEVLMAPSPNCKSLPPLFPPANPSCMAGYQYILFSYLI